MKRKTISVIMPAYNSSDYITRAVQSVFNQTRNDWELIIVDDCSEDDTLEVLKKEYSHFENVKVLKNKKNMGAAYSRNVAIEKSKGRFIAFLDSDDYWYPDKLDKQIKFMLAQKIAFSFSAYDVINHLGDKVRSVEIPYTVSYHELLNTCVIGCLTVVYDTKVLGKLYMPNIKKRQDYALWLNILKNGQIAYGIKEPLGCYCEHEGSISYNKLKVIKYNWYLYRNIENLSFFESCYRFLNYSVRGFFRRYLPRLSKFLGIMG